MNFIKKMQLVLFALWFPIIAHDAATINALLGRGMNLGNMLEAPSEGEWGVKLDSAYFPLIKSKGFTSVRIPVRWSTAARMDTVPPYAIKEIFMKRVQWAVDRALKNHLAVVLNVHHYNELFQDPDGQRSRFIAIWKQVAPFFKNYPDSLVFEILNEPNEKLTPQKWNGLMQEALDTIRHSNPVRTVILGTAEWGGIGALQSLRLPSNDPNLILTVHYYFPFTFTHQKASWVKGSEAWEVGWEGSYFDKQSIADDFEYVSRYSKQHKLPVFIGEFGANKNADMGSRVRWTAYCCRLFERLGFSWSYWEFCSNFGIYDPDKKTFRDSLVNALVSGDTTVLQLSRQEFYQGANMLKNGDFSMGKQHWKVAVVEGQAKDSIVGGAIHLSIIDPGPTTYSIHVAQDSLALEKGKRYLFAFDAWAGGSKVINAKVQESQNYNPYAVCKGVMLTSTKRRFMKAFTMAETRTDCRIEFDVGGADTTGVYFDNIVLCPEKAR